MKNLFPKILIMLSVIAFSGVNAENKGSPCAIENSITQSIFDVPAIASTEVNSFSEVATTDNVAATGLSFAVINPDEIIAVDSGQGYKRFAENIYTNSDSKNLTGGILNKRSEGLFKPGHNHIAS